MSLNKKCTITYPLNMSNIEQCNTLYGDFIIDNSTFQHLSPSNLGILRAQYVFGNISITASHPEFKNLSVLRFLTLSRHPWGRTEVNCKLEITNTSLETVELTALGHAFGFLVINNPHLKSLYLSSLKKLHGNLTIRNNPFLENLGLKHRIDITGHSSISNNPRLCYLPPKQVNTSGNGAEEYCEKEKRVCHKECDGCWGPGPQLCDSCNNFALEKSDINFYLHTYYECHEKCPKRSYVKNTNEKICLACRRHCDECNGLFNCLRCSGTKVINGYKCEYSCPYNMYNSSGVCEACHPACSFGCSGPSNQTKSGGCSFCEKLVVNPVHPTTITKPDSPYACVPLHMSCPKSSYETQLTADMRTVYGVKEEQTGDRVCLRCHPECKNCTGPGLGEDCLEDLCGEGYYMKYENSSKKPTCLLCHTLCKTCCGPKASDCITCKGFKIKFDLQATSQVKNKSNISSSINYCTPTCPPELPVVIKSIEGDYCSATIEPELDMAPLHGGLAAAVVFFFLLSTLMIFLGIKWRKRMRERARESAVKMSMVLQGLQEPLEPTNEKPNLAKLRIIKENEIKRFYILGAGAFGTVFEGSWLAEGEVVSIHVAIKALHDRTETSSLLDEAQAMARMDHPNLLRLLGVCLAADAGVMLITQVMPLGCLLDYVRAHKDDIGSKPLLNWCTQISRGMAYLEEQRFVHRDLAARNVLLQTLNCAKITDFGLARLLDAGEGEYWATEGKLPVKWLALESLTSGVFTHKTDVWTFGVTVWELLTYGSGPFENVPPRDLAELLQRGERLPQPAICSIELYTLIIKCWTPDPKARPSFTELVDHLAKMARDPARYLVIEGDELKKLPVTGVEINNVEGVYEQASLSADSLLKQNTVCASDDSQPSMQTEGDNGCDEGRMKPTGDSWSYQNLEIRKYVNIKETKPLLQNIDPSICSSGYEQLSPKKPNYSNLSDEKAGSPLTSVNNPEYFFIG